MTEKGSATEIKSKNEFISDAEGLKNKIATAKSTLKERYNLCRLSGKKLSLAYKEMRDAETKQIRTATKKSKARAEAAAYEYNVAYKEHKSLVDFFESIINDVVDLYEKLIELCPEKERKLSAECEKFENTQKSYAHEFRSILTNMPAESDGNAVSMEETDSLTEDDTANEDMEKALAAKAASAVSEERETFSERPVPTAIYKIPANTVPAPDSHMGMPQYQQAPPQYQNPYGNVQNPQYAPYYQQQYGMNNPMMNPQMPQYKPYEPYGMPQQAQNVNIASATIDIAPIVEDAVAAAMEKFKATFATRADEYVNMLSASNKNILAMEEKICEDEKVFIDKLAALMESIKALANEMTELSATFMQLSGQHKDAIEIQRKVNDMQRALARELQGVQVKQKVLNQDQAAIIEEQVVIQEQQKATAELQRTLQNPESAASAESAPATRRGRKKKAEETEAAKADEAAEQKTEIPAAEAAEEKEASAAEASECENSIIEETPALTEEGVVAEEESTVPAADDVAEEAMPAEAITEAEAPEAFVDESVADEAAAEEIAAANTVSEESPEASESAEPSVDAAVAAQAVSEITENKEEAADAVTADSLIEELTAEGV